MKRNFAAGIALIAAAGLFLSLLTGCSGKPANGEHKITICATTDIHGAYFDKDYKSGEQNSTSLAKVSSYLKGLRGEGAKPVLIDVGDALQGDEAAYYYNYVNTKDEHVFCSMAKYLKYDALVVGNHDIEAGPDVYNRVQKAFPKSYLAANAIINNGENRGKCYFSQYTVVKRDGLKIAIIGMTNGNIKSWVPKEKWENIDFFAVSNIAQMIVDGVRNEVKPDIVVLAVHSGKGFGFPGIENEAEYLASDLAGVDLILFGHDHKPMFDMIEGRKSGVMIMNAGKKAEFVAKAEIDVTVENHKIVKKSITGDAASMKDIAADEEFNSKFAKQYEEVKAFATRKIGTLAEDIDMGKAVEGPSEFINLIQTAQLKASGADISFAAPLSSNGTISKGDITYHDLTNIYRFENQLFVIKMTGKQIKDYLEASYQSWVNNLGAVYNYDSAEGIIYEVSKSAESGSRVNIISMADGSAFDPEKTYNVAITSYRASGGGSLLQNGAGINPSDVEIIKKLEDIRTIIGNYIEAAGTITPALPTNWKFID